MIVFNQDLLQNIENKDAAKVVLFAINEGIIPFDRIKLTDMVVTFVELMNKNVIISTGEGNFHVSKALYVHSEIEQEGDIQNLRKLFSKNYSGQPGLMGKKEEVEEALNAFFKKNPKVSFKEVEYACKAYIQNCLLKKSYISKLHNFINGDLEVWVEQNVKSYEDESLLDKS